MGRLRRFPENRYVGRRDQMIVYDCDDASQFEALTSAMLSLELDSLKLIQTFAPDTLPEASNRGFREMAPAS